MSENLKTAIVAWDQKSAEAVGSIYSEYSEAPDFIDDLLALLDSPECQRGATWLLKAWFEHDHAITDTQVATLISHLESLEPWESKLHLLQCFPFLSFGSEQKTVVEQFLRSNLTDKNKFVRAWSYNGFYELAKQYPEYRNEVEQFFDMAMRDEAASVKARIRNIMKSGF